MSVHLNFIFAILFSFVLVVHCLLSQNVCVGVIILGERERELMIYLNSGCLFEMMFPREGEPMNE